MNGWLHSEFEGLKKSTKPKGSNEGWCDKYAPKRKCDLTVHKKKVETVCSVLTEALCTGSKYKVVILSGPPGCGKSATVRALSNDIGFHIEEWSTPVQKYEEGVQYESEKAKFKSFLLSSSRYPSLFSTTKQSNDVNTKKIVLIEDMPTFVAYHPEDFWDTIKEYSKFGKFPIVMIMSDSSQGYRVPHQYLNIAFNPIANTLLSKALKAIADAEKLSTDIASIVDAANGDLRNAILTLQFSSVTASGMERVNGKRKKKAEKSTKPIGVHSKDKSLFIFHAIGKILYAKRDEEGPLDCPQYPSLARKPLECNPEDVAEACVLSSDMLGQFLHHNYLGFYDDIDPLLLPSDVFCDSDILTAGWVDSVANSQMEKYGSSLTTRAMLFSKDTTVASKWTPICKPVQRETNEKCTKHTAMCRDQFALEHSGSHKSFLVDTLPFLRKIGFKPRNNEQHTLMHDLTTYDRRAKSGQSLGDKEPVFYSSQDDTPPSDTQNKEDLYMTQCKVLEDEIEEFSD